jgi:hypothetical protein
MKKILFATIWVSILCLLAGIAQAMTVTLAWDPNSEPDLAGYNVYYSTDPLIPAANRTKVNIALTATGFVKTAPQWAIPGLSDTVRLYFCVTAYDNEIPSLESGYSNIVNAAYVDIFKGKAPAIPGGLRITQVVTTVSTTTVTNKVAMMK